MTLRYNQKLAIDISVKNDFESGIHYHATGTGKSWIAMFLLNEFNNRYPNKNVLWICERKDILLEQFSKSSIKNRGFGEILKKFNILNFVEKKHDNWYDSLNSSVFWGKPFLCIINRCFLTSQQKYRNIRNKIDLVIHDECHSIENNTSQEFYKWILVKFNPNIIGFSATPVKQKPLDRILSQYSIYDGFLDKVILPPKIIWMKSEKQPSTEHLIEILLSEINKLPYKKIIVWCGMIEECIDLAEKWCLYLQDYIISIDFNNIQNKKKKFSDYETFYQAEKKAILFCAVKHREGSDIPNLDGCIFMDLVEKRSERVFIQCMGRVLRKDPLNKKQYGLVIDVKAKSSIHICNRIQKYLKLRDIFPWSYTLQNYKIDNQTYIINELNMIKPEKVIEKENIEREYTRDEIISFFKRPIPNKSVYHDRLNHEIDLIISKKIFHNIIRALEILKLTKNIPHITRGSCGSSLVCYLLGISHVDPIEHNISFARFLNQYRDNLPDIDFDFPHYIRDEVFLKLFQKWGNKVARISNHIYYHEKSALREALRQNGIHEFISKYDINQYVKSLNPELRQKIHDTQQKLDGQFKGFSLHCGGIIYYPNGIPEEYILEKSNSILPQVELNKIDVSENKNFKIDILSSRGISQLYYCHHFQTIDFNAHIGDKKTIELLCSCDNIGITLAETPLMRKALKLIQPTSISELAICLSIIRPAAKHTKQNFENGTYTSSDIIYDDDAIRLISKLVDCDEDLADKLRRGYCKNKKDSIEIIDKYLQTKDINTQKKIKKLLGNLRKYGFCKAHAMSYAQLVWQLAYQKAHNPVQFWEATLKNVDSCYKKWVHIYEAKCHGIDHDKTYKHKSIYSLHKNKKNYEVITPQKQIREMGYWIMNTDDFFPDCYYFIDNNTHSFQGIIASTRMIQYGKNRKMCVFLGVDRQKYIEIIVESPFYYDSRKIITKGKGIITNKIYNTILCEGTNVEFN